jgi:hypothetical protein
MTLEQEFEREVEIWKLINQLKVKLYQENKIIPSDSELRHYALMKLEQPIHSRLVIDFYI